MAPRTKKDKEEGKEVEVNDDDFSKYLIGEINKSVGPNEVFDFSGDAIEDVFVNRWISTGCNLLDYMIANRENGGIPCGRITEIYGPACHGKGDKVLKYDGSTINVEDIKVGDLLLGPDGNPRKVLELHSGIDELYKIKPNRGGKVYTVNQHHLLSLKKVKSKLNSKTISKKDEIITISVKEYVKKPTLFKERQYRQQKAIIKDYNNSNVRNVNTIDAYFLGLLLGDGSICSSSDINITTSDKEIVEEIYKNADYFSLAVRKKAKKGEKATTYRFTKGCQGSQKTNLVLLLEKINVLGTYSYNKFIPNEYKFGSYETRLEILAGLIDTDGHYDTKGCFDYISKSKQLAEDVQFIANSLGLFATLREKHTKKTNRVYYRITISGSINIIPTRLPRKQAKISKKETNSNLTGFKLIRKGKGQYFGFELDGDHLYLTDDFTVFHNSIGKSFLGYQLIKSVQKMGGIGFLIDTEYAVMPEYLEDLGINTKNKFVFSREKCIEKIFQLIDNTISLAANKKKDVPILIVVDSVAAAASKAELEGDYDKISVGEMARALSKGLKKLTEVVGKNGVTLVLLNQTRKNIMASLYADPDESTGGVAIKYYSSVRVKLSGGSAIREEEGKADSMIIGNNVIATTIKNKVAYPRRKCEFKIIFGIGTDENDSLFDELRKCGKATLDDKNITLEGTSQWKTFTVSDSKTGEILIEKKFHKGEFTFLFNTPEYKPYFTALMNAALIISKQQSLETQE